MPKITPEGQARIILKDYLEIQERIGRLMEITPYPEKDTLRKVSVMLLEVKRKLIGTIDEIQCEVPLALE